VTIRRMLTASLLLFVAVSVVTMAVKGWQGETPSNGLPAGVTEGTSTEGRQVIAYYFLGRVRCSSCRKIEEISRKTIEGSFPRELADGRLRFLVVNVDQPENRHFIEEFRLESSSLILVGMRGGKPSGWKNLPEVWTLVDDPPRLETHIRDEVASLLKGT
jgi:hypothetical protein